jgi:hypothetical protein
MLEGVSSPRICAGAELMNRTASFLATCALSLSILDSIVGAQPRGGWTTLFDGSSLKGWNVVGDANWEVVDKAVQADKGSGFLVTPISYGDFQFTAEFWVSDDANSGVFLRCQDPKAITQTNAYEVNIFDKRPDQTYRTGGIVDVAKPASVIMTGGKWNTFDITARGTKLTVILNGTKMVDVDDSKHARGPIALQYGAGTVKFRNVRVRTL